MSNEIGESCRTTKGRSL